MRGHLSLEFVCLVDERFQFVKTVLSSADRIAFRQDPAGRASLDHIGAVLDLITHGGANLFRAVGDPVDRTKLHDAGAKTIFVAVSAGDSNCMTSSFDARPGRPAFVDGFAQGHVVEASGSADVPHAGEAGHQSVARIAHAQDPRERFIVFDRGHVAFGIAEHAPDQVRVRIDESGQQRHVAKIDDLCA